MEKEAVRIAMKTFSNYDFHMYTEIVFGKDTENRVADLIRKYKGTKVMFVYGSGSIKKSGLYDRVVDALNKGGLPFIEFGGVKPNPLRSKVEEGIKAANDFGADFFLGVGGGSTIDTAKAIALAIANDGEYWPYYQGVEPKKMASVGTINTIAAAGSETSRSSVLVDDIETGRKEGFLWYPCRPCFAIMNPELMYTLPPYQTAAGAADIFSHTYFRFFHTDSCYLGDEYGIGTFRTVVKFAPIAVADPNNYEARAELMASAAFSHNDLTGIGKSSGQGGGEHALEQQLSGYYDTAHGAGLAVMMPALLEYIVKYGSAEKVEKIAYFAVRVFDVEPDADNPRKVAEEGIARFRAWIKAIGMPITLSELGVPEADVPAAIDRCVQGVGGKISGYVDIDADGMAEIYNSVI